jgi:hypothetical protein
MHLGGFFALIRSCGRSPHSFSCGKQNEGFMNLDIPYELLINNAMTPAEQCTTSYGRDGRTVRMIFVTTLLQDCFLSVPETARLCTDAAHFSACRDAS